VTSTRTITATRRSGDELKTQSPPGATDELRERTSDLNAANQLAFRHLLVYRRRRVLLEAYDAGHGWVYASRNRVLESDRAEITKGIKA
jgi:hypothetical protein